MQNLLKEIKIKQEKVIYLFLLKVCECCGYTISDDPYPLNEENINFGYYGRLKLLNLKEWDTLNIF